MLENHLSLELQVQFFYGVFYQICTCGHFVLLPILHNEMTQTQSHWVENVCKHQYSVYAKNSGLDFCPLTRPLICFGLCHFVALLE